MPQKSPEDRGTRYASHWTESENANILAPTKDLEAEREKRKKNYVAIAKDYYDLTTDNLEAGWGPRFHFCPFPDPNESIDAAMSRHEHFLALMMGLKPGMRGLDAGCGTGGPSREIARFAGVHITGLTINKLHVKRAGRYAELEGLGGMLEYVEGDFMHIPFPDNHFDFIYATEATVYAPSLTAVYTEIARVLKPGGVFGVYEWLLTDTFDTTNPRHLSIRQRIERGDGVTNLSTIKEGLRAFERSGLRLEWAEDMALRTCDKPWGEGPRVGGGGLVGSEGKAVKAFATGTRMKEGNTPSSSSSTSTSSSASKSDNSSTTPSTKTANPDPKKWYYCIDGATHHTTNWRDWWLVLRLKPGFFLFLVYLTLVLEKLGVMRRGRLEALKTQGISVWGMRDGGREGVFTTSFLMVGRKPEGWRDPREGTERSGKKS